MATPLPKIGNTQQGGGLLDYVVKGVENAANGAGQFVKTLPQQLLQEQQTPGQIAQTVRPNSAAADVLSGNLSSIPSDLQNTVKNEAKNVIKNPLSVVAGTLGGDMSEFPEGTILDSQGNPMQKPAPDTVGSYARDKLGNLTPKNPTPAVNTMDTSAADQQTSGISSQMPKIGKPVVNPSQPEETAQTPYPFEKSPGAFSKIGKGQNDAIRQIRLKASIGGAQAESDVHDTLDRLGIQGSAQQQYSQLQPAMDTLDSYIRKELNTNPKPIPVNEIKQAFLDNLNDQFRRGEILKPAAQKEIDNYVTGLQSEIEKSNFQENPTLSPGQNTINQINSQGEDSIASPNVYKMKVIANGDASSVYKKIMNNTSLSDTDKVVLAGRNALDQVISKYHPTVKSATLDMSNLYNAAPSLEAARDNPPPQPDIAENIIPKNLRETIPFAPLVNKGINAVANNPTARKIIGGVAAGGILGGAGYILGKGFNPFSKSPQQNAEGIQNGQESTSPTDSSQNVSYIHSSNIPQTLDQVKPDQTNNYSVVSPLNIIGPDNKPIAMGGEQAIQQSTQLEGQLKNMEALGLTKTPQYAQLQTQYDNLQNKQAAIQSATDAYGSYSQITNLIKDAKARLAGAPNDLLVNTTFDKLSTVFDGKYKQLATDLQTLDKANASAGILSSSLFNQQTTQTALDGLNQIGQNAVYSYYSKYINPLLGNVGENSLTTSTPPSTQPITPSSAMPAPSAKVSIYQAPSSTQMPSMPNFQQMGASFAGQ